MPLELSLVAPRSLSGFVGRSECDVDGVVGWAWASLGTFLPGLVEDILLGSGHT